MNFTIDAVVPSTEYLLAIRQHAKDINDTTCCNFYLAGIEALTVRGTVPERYFVITALHNAGKHVVEKRFVTDGRTLMEKMNLKSSEIETLAAPEGADEQEKHPLLKRQIQLRIKVGPTPSRVEKMDAFRGEQSETAQISRMISSGCVRLAPRL